MIDFKEAGLLSVLPEQMDQVETKALSAAIEKGLGMLHRYSKAVSVYAALSNLPDEALDLLAVELRTQYYDPEASRRKREQMVRQTIAWYFHGGTGAVLTEYLAALYQGGRLEEWYEYGGKPYFFKAVVDLALDDEVRPGDGKGIVERINQYKNVRSWLEALSFHIGADFAVPVEYENDIRFQTQFYPRYNLGFLYLNALWKLDGSRKLNGYDSDELLDFYPVGIRFESAVSTEVQAGYSGLGVLAGAEVQVESREELSVKTSASSELSVETGVRILTSASSETGTRSSMTKLRYLDGTWMLDGSRPLDGGRYEL